MQAEQLGSGTRKVPESFPCALSGVSESRSVLPSLCVLSALESEGYSSCCCHHGLAFRCPGEFEIFYWGKIHHRLVHEGLGALNLA